MGDSVNHWPEGAGGNVPVDTNQGTGMVVLPNPLVDQTQSNSPQQPRFTFYSDPLAALNKPQLEKAFQGPMVKRARFGAVNTLPQPTIQLMQPGIQLPQAATVYPMVQIAGQELAGGYVIPGQFGLTMPVGQHTNFGLGGAPSCGPLGFNQVVSHGAGKNFSMSQGKKEHKKGGWKNIDAARYYKKSMIEDPWKGMVKSQTGKGKDKADG